MMKNSLHGKHWELAGGTSLGKDGMLLGRPVNPISETRFIIVVVVLAVTCLERLRLHKNAWGCANQPDIQMNVQCHLVHTRAPKALLEVRNLFIYTGAYVPRENDVWPNILQRVYIPRPLRGVGGG